MNDLISGDKLPEKVSSLEILEQVLIVILVSFLCLFHLKCSLIPFLYCVGEKKSECLLVCLCSLNQYFQSS